MKYRVTHLKTGRVSILEAEKVRQIQENGFGGLFTFETITDKKPEADEWHPVAEEETEKIEAEKPTKAKKTPK